MMLTSVGVVLFLLCGYKKEWGRVCLKVFLDVRLINAKIWQFFVLAKCLIEIL